MDVEKISCDSTTCNFGYIPSNVISFEIFTNLEFDAKFCKIFSLNLLNPTCYVCYINFAKLLYALLKMYDDDQEVDIHYCYTHVFIMHGFRNFMNTLKVCRNLGNEMHANYKDLLCCESCVSNSLLQLEIVARSFFGYTWRPPVSFGVASVFLHRVFTELLFQCKCGCIPDQLEMLLDEM